MQDATASPSILTLPVDDTPIEQAAVLYARAGLAPVPIYGLRGVECMCGRKVCLAKGKHPQGHNWQRQATRDVDAVLERFRHHVGNIGILLGDTLVAIDIDEYNGGLDGLAKLPPLPPTLTARTGSGKGEHRIYRYAPGQNPADVTNRKIARGVDVKTRDAQIVVAPSLHLSGGRYQWIDLRSPALLSDELYEAIRKDRVVPIRPDAAPSSASEDLLYRRAQAYVATIPPAVSGSGGHAQTFSAARACWGWVQKGLSASRAKDLLREYSARCEPPWSERELEHKWSEAQKATCVPCPEDRPRAGGNGTPTGAPVLSVVSESDWRSRLIFEPCKSGPDKPAKHVENAVVVLRYCPDWRGRIYWDEHAQRVFVESPPWHESDAPGQTDDTPREWNDTDSARLSGWIRREVCQLNIPVGECDRAVAIAAEGNPRHPFREYLDGLPWDGVERLPHWLSDHVGAPHNPYTASVGTWWMVAAVARIYSPGCKADNVLILEGEQGIRKSSALRTLAGARWFSDTAIDIGSKDAYLALQGRVIVELAELESLRKADADRAKYFFSSPVDIYRPPYGRRTITVPRQCVFAGTVNHTVYLTDDTGNRRYWPIRCGEINLVSLAAARDHLWAEAAARYRWGDQWWPDSAELCREEQAEREEVDEWEAIIAQRLIGTDETAVGEIWADVFKGQPDKLGRAEQMRIAKALRRLQFRRFRESTGSRQWRYRRK